MPTATDCEPCRISRRAALRGAGALATVAVAVPSLSTGVAFASTNSTRVGDGVVTVFLRGGMDGLSVVVPRHEGAGAGHYVAARPSVAVDPAATLALTPDFGLHPSMAALVPLWQRGILAIVPAAGFPVENRSHFSVQRWMDLGLAGGGIGSGWLARHLDVTPTTEPVGLRAATLPFGQRSLSGSSVSVTMGSLESFRITGFTGAGGAVQAALHDMHGVAGDSVVTLRASEALAALDLVANAEVTPPANGAAYPVTGRGRTFGRTMAQIAQLIRADVGLEAAATEASLGWDLHQGLGAYTDGRMQENVQALAEVLAAFAVDLGPLIDRVTVVLMTEFGRTFRENGNAGLDHGRASTMMVFGGGIRGGLYGDWPGLAPADIDRNGLRVTTDYRYVLADVLEERLGTADLAAVLPGFVPDPALRLGLATVDPSVEAARLAAAEPEPAVVPPAPPVTSGPGTYGFTDAGGAVVRFAVPAPGDHPDVVALEAARLEVGAEPCAYVVATVDNAAGADEVRVPSLLVDDEAGTLVLREAWLVVDLWRASVAPDAPPELAARLEALSTALADRGVVPAGASGATVLAAPGAVTTVLAVRADAADGEIPLAQT
ncbi:MAG TPA: DUF1501 domain-containing protein [Acidimicrobiales bacterium]|nr:DUF1501 domain-containing protein [Acidimicrobiales bacterium]